MLRVRDRDRCPCVCVSFSLSLFVHMRSLHRGLYRFVQNHTFDNGSVRVPVSVLLLPLKTKSVIFLVVVVSFVFLRCTQTTLRWKMKTIPVSRLKHVLSHFFFILLFLILFFTSAFWLFVVRVSETKSWYACFYFLFTSVCLDILSFYFKQT